MEPDLFLDTGQNENRDFISEKKSTNPTKKPKILPWLLIGLFGGMAIANSVFNKPDVIPLAVSNPVANTKESTNTKNQELEEPDVAVDTTVLETERQALIDQVNELLSDELNNVDQTRADYFLKKAWEQAEKDGTPTEIYLIRKLNYQVKLLVELTAKGSELRGNPKQTASARSLLGDLKALVVAINRFYSQNGELTNARVSVATTAEVANNLSKQVMLIRQLTLEQRLRDAKHELEQKKLAEKKRKLEGKNETK